MENYWQLGGYVANLPQHLFQDLLSRVSVRIELAFVVLLIPDLALHFWQSCSSQKQPLDTNRNVLPALQPQRR